MPKTARQILDMFRNDPDVSGLVLVECTEGSSARLTFFKKFSGGVPFWTPVFSSAALIGENGPGKTEEGDRKTPLGIYSFTGAFGISDNPGTALPYLKIGKNTFASSENGPFYNRILTMDRNGPELSGEWMLDYVPGYNYGLIFDFNAESRYPLGSHIFLHCRGNAPYTAGCIAAEEAEIKTLLLHLKKNDKICIIESLNKAKER